MGNSKKHSKPQIYSWKDYWEFFAYARRRIQSEQDYFSFEKFQGSLLVRYLLKMGVPLQNSLALDLGCGFGGYSAALQEAGASPVGLDLDSVRLAGTDVKVSADARFTPFKENFFSVIICSSLIEHIPQPGQLLAEIDRILQTGGYLYLSFPPFYSPVGGHQFAPFHLLGENIALKVFKWRRDLVKKEWVRQYLSFSPSSYTTSFGSWGLYRRSITWAKNELSNYPWDILDCSTRFSPFNTSRIPLLGEFLTWHVQFLILKR